MIPASIKIGCFEVKVQIVKNLAYDRDRIGEFCPRNLTIDIEETSSLQRQWETLFHEIIEAINSQYNLELPHQTIHILGSAFFQVIRDNTLDCNVTE